MKYSIQPEIRISNIEEIGKYVDYKDNILVLTSKPITEKNNLESVFSNFERNKDRFQFVDDVPDENPFSYISELYGKLNFIPSLIIAVGGGSVIDLAKAISVAANFKELESIFYREKAVEKKYSKVYVFPTTFGTGAELSFGAILFDDAKNIKSGIRGELVQANKVFLDYQLYKSAPRRIKSLAGFDCLTHAIETYLSRKSSELTRYQSVAAINVVFEYLVDAVLDDTNAISRMAIASMLMGANLAYSTTCLPHRLQYVIGPITHTSHSEGLAALYKGYLPYICSMKEGPVKTLSENLNISSDSLVKRVNTLKDRLDVSVSLTDLGIIEKDFQFILANVTGNLSDDPYYKDNISIKEILRLAL